MDRTAMSHNDTAHNGKTQTGSMFLVCDEGLEDGFLILRRDAAAIVTDCQQHPFVVGEDLQCDSAPFLNGVDGVGEQIDKYLFQADRICIKIRISVIKLQQQWNVVSPAAREGAYPSGHRQIPQGRSCRYSVCLRY